MGNEATYQQPCYSIGTVARLTGLSTHTLRMWERRYGLGASRRTASGQREFTKVDLDHLKLIKQLIDDGMRIGDIAKLPKKTLTGLRQHEPAGMDKVLSDDSIDTIVIGHQLAMLFGEHSKRYPQLNIELPDNNTIDWLLKDSAATSAKVFFLHIDALNKSCVSRIKQLKKDTNSIFLHYHYASPELINRLDDMGVTTVRGNIDISHIDDLVKLAIEQQNFTTLLQQSAEKFNVSLPASKPHVFNQSQLTAASQIDNKLDCQCPSHLTEIISSLNTFEEYSQQCEAGNWKEAAIHACIYAYTSQARHLMEKALLAVIEEH